MPVCYDDAARVLPNGSSVEQMLDFASIASNDANADGPIDSAALSGDARCKRVDAIEDVVNAPQKVCQPDQHVSAAFHSIAKVRCFSLFVKHNNIAFAFQYNVLW